MLPESSNPRVESDRHGHLRLSVRTSDQLFNSFDPSPFYEKDLDANAEQFLVSWAGDLHPHADLRLTLYLKEPPAQPGPEHWLPHATHRNFAERARLERATLKRLLRQGRVSLVIGVAFLTLCMVLAQVLGNMMGGTLELLVREGFLIAGWVAMWRPLQIYLYEWWPLLHKLRLYGRMARMPVELRVVPA